MTSTSAPSSKKRSSLSALQKKELFSVILSESNKWLSVDETVSTSQFKKNQQANWPQLEETLAIWFDEAKKHN
nr:1688_t:CDS:2 [Entrophospora candida]